MLVMRITLVVLTLFVVLLVMLIPLYGSSMNEWSPPTHHQPQLESISSLHQNRVLPPPLTIQDDSLSVVRNSNSSSNTPLVVLLSTSSSREPLHDVGFVPFRRFLYTVLTSNANHGTRLRPLLTTWGRHATIPFLISDSHDPKFPRTRNLGPRHELGRKTLSGLREFCRMVSRKTLHKILFQRRSDIHSHHNVVNGSSSSSTTSIGVGADFYVISDDDTFIITHNLEEVISTNFDPKVPCYVGYALTHLTEPFIGGGGGVVLSNATMEKFCSEIGEGSAAENHISEGKKKGDGQDRMDIKKGGDSVVQSPCNPDADFIPKPGDMALFQCMNRLKISATHQDGFHPLFIHKIANPDGNYCSKIWWMPHHIQCHPPNHRLISMHYVPVDRFYEVYYWAYLFRYDGEVIRPKKRFELHKVHKKF